MQLHTLLGLHGRDRVNSLLFLALIVAFLLLEKISNVGSETFFYDPFPEERFAICHYMPDGLTCGINEQIYFSKCQ